MKRTTKQNPCSICGKSDWCGVSDDETIAVCMREIEGSIGIARNGGFIHILKECDLSERRTRIKKIKVKPKQDDTEYRRLNDLMHNAINESAYQALSKQIGLSVESFDRLYVGWCNCLKVWSFPMFAPDGRIIGFRLRTPKGKKFSMIGGKEGLFIPRDLRFDNRQLLICEGPTDTAACLDLGFDAIGRPSCLGAVKLTVAFISEQWPLEVVIVSDGDIAGLNGASKLASAVAGVSRTVRIIEPPTGVKDIRAWKRQGATCDDLLNLIQQSKPINIAITGGICE